MKPVLVALAFCLAAALPARADAPMILDKSAIPREDLTDLNLIQSGVGYCDESAEGAGVRVSSGTWYEIYRYHMRDGTPSYLILGKVLTPTEGDKLLEAYTKTHDQALWKQLFEKHPASAKVNDVLLLNRTIIHLEGDLAYVTTADGDLTKAPDGGYTLMDRSTMNIARGHVVLGMPGDKTPDVMVRPVVSASRLP
jgi:hypothetical protein